ncbi:hypothetical protein WR25_08096 [Diploscapter pachys]|uniref:CUB domain-containing protein n=1 Tax=Diploscapter pachys TaxID=2018661 RepID=A0A2A2LMB5_9BILA|nr:hypothetical protein WR25_08096 [Diploscapter pachys]
MYVHYPKTKVITPCPQPWARGRFAAPPKRLRAGCNGGMLGGPSTFNGTLFSPNFPNAYFNNIDCRYQINAPAGHYIGLSFDPFFLQDKNDFVSVYDGPEIDEAKLIQKFNATSPTTQCQGPSNQMTLWFHTDHANVDIGWYAKWVAKRVLSPINQSGPSGVLTSPNYPNHYDSFTNQLYTVKVNPRSRVRARVVDFDTEENYDNLLIYEGMVQEPQFLVANLSGTRGVKWDHTFAGDSFSMKFISDRADQRKGWRMSWTQV